MDTQQQLLQRFEQLNEIGTALSNERDINRLLEKILLAAKQITHADGGTLYLVAEDKRHLHFEIVRTDSLALAFGGTSGIPTSGNFPDVPLYHPDGRPNQSMVAAHAALTGQTIHVADAYAAAGFDFSGTRQFDARTGYRSRSFLTVPMRSTHDKEVIGVLQLINAIDQDDGSVREFSLADQHLAESLASQAAVALTNRQLMLQLEALFEALIRLINVAIDEKSPYTAGHCQRVPELTMLLADAVAATRSGPLAEFTLSEADRYELRIAALMHDCGKITTPVHIIDKSTKLEAIHDRMQVLDLRFVVLKREAEARMWQQIANGGERSQAEATYRDFCQQCDVDRDFLRQANIGSEKMRDADIERVRQIATAYPWVDEAGQAQPFLSADELENLCIRAGTLTAAERQIINNHISATIRMLEQLPWPKHLRNVPEYAGGHHERMDGKGYPRGLTREQMSWQARMMGIADIFEALTAKDRPYKVAMPLSQALRIMENFRDNGHIDPDLFAIFVEQRVYLDYARRYLAPEQIDC